MQRFFLPALLIVALVAAGCSKSNNKNNAPAVTPLAGNLVPRNTTPSLVATPIASPSAVSAFSVAQSPTPVAGGSPRATTPTPAAAATSSASAPTGTAAAASPSATATASAPAAAAATTAPTSAPAAGASVTSTAAANATAASGGPADPRALIAAIKPADSDLPAGFTAGQLSGYQANEQSITGYDNPQGVLDLLNSTGRQDGYYEQLGGPNGNASYSIQVWQDAGGAKTFFDQHPVPDSTVQFKQVQLDQPLGEQYQALLIGSGPGASYALSWRVGRVVLGVGGAAGADGKPSAALLQLANALTTRAQSAQQ